MGLCTQGRRRSLDGSQTSLADAKHSDLTWNEPRLPGGVRLAKTFDPATILASVRPWIYIMKWVVSICEGTQTGTKADLLSEQLNVVLPHPDDPQLYGAWPRYLSHPSLRRRDHSYRLFTSTMLRSQYCVGVESRTRFRFAGYNAQRLSNLSLGIPLAKILHHLGFCSASGLRGPATSLT